MASPYGIKTLIRRTFSRRYAVARLTRRPLFGNLVDRLLFEGDDLMVLPRDQVIPVNRSLAPRKDMAVPSQVLEHFIDQARFHWKKEPYDALPRWSTLPDRCVGEQAQAAVPQTVVWVPLRPRRAVRESPRLGSFSTAAR